MQSRTVSNWMSTPVVTVPPTFTLAGAQRLMEERRVRRLVVVEEQQLVGIVTWGDIRAAWPSAASTLGPWEWRAMLEQITIAECMTPNPITVAVSASVLDAAQLMLNRKIGGLPVMDGEQVVGIITESDLFRLLINDLLAQQPSAEAPHVREQVVCHHCGAVMRGQAPQSIGPDAQCWNCYYHLHRCDNCRHFDGVGCMLGRPERHETIPGQHCPAFTYRMEPVSSGS